MTKVKKDNNVEKHDGQMRGVRKILTLSGLKDPQQVRSCKQKSD